MPDEDIIKLGEHLGLSRPKLLRMKDMPGDMVAAWLRQEDHVITKTGTPTWRTLADALDVINQRGVAEVIRTYVGIESCHSGKKPKSASGNNRKDSTG